MSFFKRKMSRAEAIALAIDRSDPNDTVTIHNAECAELDICICDPVTVKVLGDSPSQPIGFRLQR